MKGKLHEQMSPHDFTPGDFQEGAFNTGQKWNASIRAKGYLKGTLTEKGLKGKLIARFLKGKLEG